MTAPLGLFGSFAAYRRDWVRPDIMAGLTVWAVLIPESLAYATIAGAPPAVGLYAAVPALVLYAALGSSRHLVVGPMSGTAALSASIVAGFASAGSPEYIATTTALALVMGLLGLVAGLLRLGFLSAFISEPVLKGFIIGLALTIMIGQVPKLLGVEGSDGNFFEKATGVIRDVPDTSGITLLIGGLALVAILALRRLVPLVPGSLAVVLVGIAAVAAFNLDDHGVAIVGTIHAGLPSFGLPDVDSHRYLDLVGPAVGVLLVGFAEGLGAAKTYAAKSGYDIDPSRELVALGGSNLGSGVLGGMVVNGSLSKTAINGSAGAKSQLSGLTVAALTVATLLFLTGLFEQLPEAILAAVVIAAVIELVDIAALRRLWKVGTGPMSKLYRHAARSDFLAAITTLIGVLVFDTLPGLFIGIAISLLTMLYRASRPYVAMLGRPLDGGDYWVDVARHPDAVATPGIVVLRVESGLFFANCDVVRQAVRDTVDDSTTAVVLDGETMPFVDVTASAMLAELAQDLDRRGITLLFARDVGQVRDVVRSTEDRLATRIFATIDQAVDAAKRQP